MVVVTRKMLDEMQRLARTGLTHAEIGRRVGGVSRPAVSRWLLKCGVRKFHGAANRAAISKLHKNKVSPAEICQRLGISKSTYYFHRLKLGIPPIPMSACLRMAGLATAESGKNSFMVRSEAMRDRNYRDGFPWCANFERKVIEYLCRVGETTIGQYAESSECSRDVCLNYFKGLKKMEWVVPVEGRRAQRFRRYVLSPVVADRLRMAGYEVARPVGVTFTSVKAKGELKFTAVG